MLANGLEPKAVGLRDIALFDPVAALGILLGIPRVPVAMTVGPVSFPSFALGQPAIKAGFKQNVSSRTWITSITLSLQQPNVFANTSMKTLYDAALRYATGLSVTLDVLGGPKYSVTDDFTPLENLQTLLTSPVWPAGWQMIKNQNVSMLFTLNETFGQTDPSSAPYVCSVTFNGWQFIDTSMDDVNGETARKALRVAGIEVADIEKLYEFAAKCGLGGRPEGTLPPTHLGDYPGFGIPSRARDPR